MHDQELQEFRSYRMKSFLVWKKTPGLNRGRIIRGRNHQPSKDPQIHSVTPELLQLLQLLSP